MKRFWGNMILLNILLPAFFALGIYALWRGLRGKRIGDHPVCNKCGYDLRGRVSESPICPECGANLNLKGAIAIGRHKRRPGLIVAGLAMGMLSVLVFLLTSSATIRNIDFNHYKPVWWLAWNAKIADAAMHDPAMKELLLRFEAGQLLMPST